MTITDYALQGSTIFVEVDDCKETDIDTKDFFDFHCEAEGPTWTCSHELQVICIPFTIPRIDKLRGESYDLPQQPSIISYDNFFKSKDIDIKQMLISFIQSFENEIEWAEHNDYDDIKAATLKPTEISV